MKVAIHITSRVPSSQNHRPHECLSRGTYDTGHSPLLSDELGHATAEVYLTTTQEDLLPHSSDDDR